MEIHQFGKDARRRIAAAVKKIEKLRPAPQRGRGFPRAPTCMMLAKANEQFLAGNSGSVSIYGGTPGSETDSGEDLTVFAQFNDVFADDWVWIANAGSGWYVLANPLISSMLGKTDAAINKGASGAVSIYIGAGGGETDTSADVTAYNHFGDVAANKWVLVTFWGGTFYLSAREC